MSELINESDGLVLAILKSKIIKPKEQIIRKTGISINLPLKTHGIIKASKNKTIKEPWVALRLLLRGEDLIKILLSDLINKDIKMKN